jgi:uncharacterized membrane protein
MGHLSRYAINLGRVFLGISLAEFGVQYFIYGKFEGGLMPGPPWMPGAPFTAYLLGAAMIAAGVSIAANARARLTATLLGVLIFVCVVLIVAAAPSATWHDGGDRTRALEPLAVCGALWFLAELLPRTMHRATPTGAAGEHAGKPPGGGGTNAIEGSADKLAAPGRWIFAFCMVVFGIQHFMYAEFIASLITPWIPWHLFWTYFSGVGFIAAGLTIAARKFATPGAASLGLMFLLWVLVLHGPRVAAHLSNGDEWSSLFVALAMSGCGFIFAGGMSSDHSQSTQG